MKHNVYALVTGLMLGTAASQGMAADAANGKKLHDANCMRCHDSAVYTREARRVTSLAGLKKQIARCELTLDLRWFDSDRADVAEYLNSEFYKF